MDCDLCQDTGVVFLENVELGTDVASKVAYRCKCLYGNKYSFAKSIEEFPFWQDLKKEKQHGMDAETAIAEIKSMLGKKLGKEPLKSDCKTKANNSHISAIESDCKKLIEWAMSKKTMWHTQEFWMSFIKTSGNLSVKYDESEEAQTAINAAMDFLEQANEDYRAQLNSKN